jgi:hypothetical protein
MKTDNYIVTATEFNEMALQFGYTRKNGISNSNKGNTKTESSAAYYLDENANPWFTYTGNRCPRYQDFVCAPSGLTVTVDTVSVYDETHTNPVYHSYYSYLFKIKATVPQVTPTVIFDITLPNNIVLGDFRYVHYNGSPVPLPTSDYYYVDIYDIPSGRVRIFLYKQVTTEYEIAFNAYPAAQYGTFTATANVSGTWCNTTVTVPGTYSYVLLQPNVVISKTIYYSANTNCVSTKGYSIDITNTGGKLIGGTLSDTLPSGLVLGQFQAVKYDGNFVSSTSDYYNLTTYQEGVNGGQIVLELLKEISPAHYYTLYFYASNVAAGYYTNTAVYQNYAYATSGSNTTYWAAAATTAYYELENCATYDYLYTTIAPLGYGNRYKLASNPDPWYTYTGSSIVDCVPPPGYETGFEQTSYYGCCTSAAHWVPIGYSCYGTCNKYETVYDDNPCSPTFGTTKQGDAVQYNSSYCYVPGGAFQCCGQPTGPVWANNGDTNCFGSCTLYQPQINTNPCYTGSPQTQNNPLGTSDSCGTWVGAPYCKGTNNCEEWYKETNSCTGNVRNDHLVNSNSTYCGGCCGQSTTPNWQNSGWGCYGTCNKYNIEQDLNSCSPTYGNQRQGSLIQSNSTDCNGCCGISPAANWVDTAPAACNACHLVQPQIDNNVCSATYGDTRDADLGLNSDCGGWPTVYYCVGYDKWSKEVNICTGAIRNETLVESNSPYCGYHPCTTWDISAYDADTYVSGTYTNCAGFSDSFSFYSAFGGYAGSICVRNGTSPSVSGGGASDTGNVCS